MPQFDPAVLFPQLFWLALIFTIFYVLVSRLILPKMVDMLESRENRINQDLQKADEWQKEAERVRAEVRIEKARANKEVQSIIADIKQEIAEDTAARQASLNQLLADKTAEAEERIAGLKREFLHELETVATDLARRTYTLASGEVPNEKALAEAVRASLPGKEASQGSGKS